MGTLNMEKEAWLAWRYDRSIWPEDIAEADLADEARRNAKPENEPEESEEEP